MQKKSRVFTAVQLLLTATAAQLAGFDSAAAQQVDGQKMQAYLHSDVHRNLVSRLVAAIPPTVFKACPTLISNGSNVKPQLNLYFSVAPDGVKINGLAAFPGSTRADLTLQQDGLRFAQIGARSKASNCEHFDVRNTRFEGFGLTTPETHDPGATEKFRPWWETWTMVGCGRTFDVMIDFIPSANGTQIVQPLGNVNER